MISVETNNKTDIDKYTKVSDLVKYVNFYNFTGFRRCEKHIQGHQMFHNLIKVFGSMLR